ncbi:MAG: alpha-1,4-glucan--maltose-1-phosphate maltosyltransferase [Gammaproteobacteria bacterium]|nr:alpha-1,4-glucan--maltose-1-phosphate maltosyltransferase [Gammaproteobacteria bacterium]NIT64242.1 alpha-1,4-glucan--maltose-1-phosphate maltosyltransferase [Gammaproteobacteria bacterium]NIV52653.1 DUF3416 domain-containing protein [Gammaproteobacteria bacterium]NIY32822.1 DUF3416 domain-containing protein [Gammaproteobacteria bacterium]
MTDPRANVEGGTLPPDDPNAGRRRVVIEQVTPAVDSGRFPAKRIIGDMVLVDADLLVDGHDQISARVRYRKEGEQGWREAPMEPLANDRWRGGFVVTEIGRYRYTVCAWVDAFASWRHDLLRRQQPEDIAMALRTGAELLAAAAERAGGEDRERLRHWGAELGGDGPVEQRLSRALGEDLVRLMARHADRSLATTYRPELALIVDVERARFSAWYELFPRSCVTDDSRHGTFRDCAGRLDEVARMGFDIVYLPPVHPIGRTKRKGRNNRLVAGPKDPGSPWAIGAEEGGHKSVHPLLGTLDDFRWFMRRANDLGLEVALDIAFQCSPDHPYVAEHPDWFRWRPDGSVQYAENPPKKYEDIYPFNFETENWQSLWQELKSVFLFWMEQGVHIFRVDNPHTKPFVFWEWLIGEIKRDDPDVLFLSEAFARPKIMLELAKLGFSQSYTYFTWRNTKFELTEYLAELTRSPVSEYFRPNFWPNTPDILSEYLQFGARPAFMIRVILAGTMSANYGIYGPAYELTENRPREPGSEEYLDSEKYQVRHWDTARPDSIRELIARINRIRRDNPALQSDTSLAFHPVDNDELICYSKHTDGLENIILTVVNLDPYHTQAGWVELPVEALDLDPRHPYQVHDLVTGSRFLWHGARNYVELDPRRSPGHIFRLRRKVRTERDFDYYF